eukprot:1143508-Pelagomonas_calceolata.AAC.1
MDSSRTPKKINCSCNHASTTHPSYEYFDTIAHQPRWAFAPVSPKAHGALSETFSKAQRTAKETLTSSGRGLSFSSSRFLHAPPLPIPLPLSFSIPLLITAVPLTIAAAAAAAADLTAYTK